MILFVDKWITPGDATATCGIADVKKYYTLCGLSKPLTVHWRLFAPRVPNASSAFVGPKKKQNCSSSALQRSNFIFWHNLSSPRKAAASGLSVHLPGPPDLKIICPRCFDGEGKNDRHRH
jgi:hypothetical protein